MKSILSFFEPPRQTSHTFVTNGAQPYQENPVNTFPDKEAVTRWFDLHFCNFYKQGETVNHPLSMEFELKKRDWLSKPENEAWYATRLNLVLQSWAHCKSSNQLVYDSWVARNSEITSALKAQMECKSAEFEAFKKDQLERYRRLADKFKVAQIFIGIITRSACVTKSIRNKATKTLSDLTS